jgi:polyisoprenoid-binding protein YceI
MQNAKIRLRYVTVALAALASSAACAASGYLPGKYTIDPAHTRASFIIPHFVVSEVEGRFNEVKGEFTLADKFADSKVSAAIPVKSVDTGVKQRDDHLRSKDFFDAAKYPFMKLVGKSFAGTPESFKLTATLTIKDVTKDVVFEGKYTGSVKDSWGNERVALRMTGQINRKDFHINYDEKVDLGPAVGDNVKIRVWTEGVRVKDAKSAAAKR